MFVCEPAAKLLTKEKGSLSASSKQWPAVCHAKLGHGPEPECCCGTVDWLLSGCPQVVSSVMITIAYACNNVRTSVGLYAIMVHIHQAEAVTQTAPIKLRLLVFGAVGMCSGTLLCGFRLVPVTGMSTTLLPLGPPPPSSRFVFICVTDCCGRELLTTVLSCLLTCSLCVLLHVFWRGMQPHHHTFPVKAFLLVYNIFQSRTHTAMACEAPSLSIVYMSWAPVLLLSDSQSNCVAATQIAKMTPFRSFCVMVVTALTLTIMALLQLRGGTITYVIVSLSLPILYYYYVIFILYYIILYGYIL